MDTTTTRERGSEPLGRLLSQEANVADLLAFLVEVDPAPLLAALALRADEPGVVQEASRGRSGRIDLLVTDAGRAIALVELKVGAAEHGDQFTRYAEHAAARGSLPCHLVSLDRQPVDLPAGWHQHLLPDLLSGWRDSSSETARVLATALERALRDVLAQADGPLGQAGRTAVALAFRLVAHRVRLLDADPGLSGGATRTSGGQPMVVFRTAHPGARSPGEWLCVDLRSEARGTDRWKLRLGVEVWPDDGDEAVARARVRAHDLATALRQALRTSTFVAHLRDVGRGCLADRLAGGAGDGLLRPVDEGALDGWREAAGAGRLAVGTKRLQRHPLFFHDSGLRLVGISHLDWQELTAEDLATLVSTGLRYLRGAAGADLPDLPDLPAG